jgi:hypothetical protein
MTWRTGLVLVALVTANASEGMAQVVADRSLVTIYGQTITQSDVWQALELGWVPEGVTTFEEARREVENRHLILREAQRLAIAVPEAEAIALARERWESAVGAANVAARLDRAGVTAASLERWLGDTAVIDAYLDRRFGGVREADRPAAIADWIRLLRDRAGLPR